MVLLDHVLVQNLLHTSSSQWICVIHLSPFSSDILVIASRCLNAEVCIHATFSENVIVISFAFKLEKRNAPH